MSHAPSAAAATISLVFTVLTNVRTEKVYTSNLCTWTSIMDGTYCYPVFPANLDICTSGLIQLCHIIYSNEILQAAALYRK